MRFTTLLTSLVIVSATALPATAGSFSFNEASADEMVNACKEEGVTLSKEIADAIVETRKTTTFAYETDLMKVPGMTNQILSELSPIEEDGDLLFDPSSIPAMKGY